MCGRVIQASPPDLLGLKIVAALDGRDNRIPTDRFGNMPARYNGAPSQELWVLRRRPDTGERSLDLLRWGLIPSWCKEKPKPPPINAKGETAAKLPMFREAFARRRCILPIDGFYEWRAIKGAKVKQPYAIAMKDRSPFGLAGLWENWKEPATGEWIRTFCRHYSAGKRDGERNPRPHAGDPQAGGLRRLARRRRKPDRDAEILPVGADDDVAYLNASELA